MIFYIENETEFEFPFDIEELIPRVAKKALELERCPENVQVNVLITDNEGIRRYNREYRGLDRETDVLSFPNLDFEEQGNYYIAPERISDYVDPETGNIVLGDIILSFERIVEQAKEYGHSIKRELAFLVVHSILHLSGYDHETKEEADCMEQKQEEVLELLGITRTQAEKG